MTSILSAVAWPYANGPQHIGHVAGFGVPSDVYSRYMRMAGHDVLMVSGTDEHGTPILVQAEQEGVSAQELADRYNRDPAVRERVGVMLDELFAQVLAWGGVITGEHGIGLAKKAWWPQATSQVSRDLHRGLKNLLDPAGILNPGKFVE